jgi:hypothetical protein
MDRDRRPWILGGILVLFLGACAVEICRFHERRSELCEPCASDDLPSGTFETICGTERGNRRCPRCGNVWIANGCKSLWSPR